MLVGSCDTPPSPYWTFPRVRSRKGGFIAHDPGIEVLLPDLGCIAQGRGAVLAMALTHVRRLLVRL